MSATVLQPPSGVRWTSTFSTFRGFALAAILVGSLPFAFARAESPACAGSVSGPPGQIVGRVLDASSAAIPGAVVILECGAPVSEATTDANGGYALQVPPGSYNLRVRQDGFTPSTTVVTVVSGQNTETTVQLEVAGVAQEITVTAGGFEQLLQNAPASVSVLPREELHTKRYASLAQALVDIEGVDVGQDVGKTGGMTISIRGMHPDYTLMLIDGKRQNPGGNVTPNGFTETATSFMPPIGAIERIEVVRGPMSTLYGSDAMGGVVNVITRKVSDRWSGTITTDGTLQQNTDYGKTGGGNFYLTGPLLRNRLGVAFRGSAFHRQDSKLRYDDAQGDAIAITAFGLSPTKSDIQNIGGRVSYLVNDNHEFYFDGDKMWQAYDNSSRQLGTLGVQGGYAEELKFNREQFLFAHQGRFGFGVLDTSFVRNVTETAGRTIPPGTPGRNPGDPRTLEATNNILDSKLIAGIYSHTLSLGGQWWDAGMVDAVAPNPYEHRQGALFAEDEWRILRQVSLTLGLRYDNHSTFGGNMSPRAYLVYHPTERFTVKGGVSRGFKTPQLNQIASGITGFGAQGTLPLIGSPGLKPETSTSTEVGGYWRFGIANFNVTLFHNEFQNKIATGPGLENCSFSLSPNRPGCVDFGNWPNVDVFGQQINVDEAVTRGVESSLRLRFLRRWDLSNNYTFTRSEQRSGSQAGQPLVNTPKHMFNSNLRFAVTEKLNTWVRVEARSNRTRGTSATALAAMQQIGPFEGYGMAHLGAGYQFNKNVTLNGTIYNLFNTNFTKYYPYVYNNATSYASAYNFLQEPRRLWLSLAYSF